MPNQSSARNSIPNIPVIKVQDVRSVEVWISSFIPNNLGNDTATVEKGRYEGQTAVKSPLPLSNSVFLDAQRSGFSPNRTKRGAKLYTKITVNARTGEHKVDRYIGSTTQVDRITGDVYCNTTPISRDAQAGNRASEFDSLLWKKTDEQIFQDGKGGKAIQSSFEVNTFGANPCFQGLLSPFTPDIDFTADLKITIGRSNKGVTAAVNLTGKVDDFPSFEAYTRANKRSEIVPLFQHSNKGGLLSLAGSANNSVTGTAVFTTGAVSVN
jgi:hypothetical protein